MSANVIRASAVTQAILDQLQAESRLSAATVTRSAPLNEMPSACPWIGVYRSQQEFAPRTLGAYAGGMSHKLALVIVVQAAGGSSGEECEDLLEALVSDTIGAILDDQSLRGTVQIVTGITVNYADYARVEGTYMQTAALYVTAETRITLH
jgi:hypothetical protein